MLSVVIRLVSGIQDCTNVRDVDDESYDSCEDVLFGDGRGA